MPKLQDQLDRITQNTRKLVQPERLAVSEASIAALFHTGIEDRILPVGAQAPAFALPASSMSDSRSGKLVRSSDLLALGPLVLSFFRGRWCPYCMTELEAWRELLPELRRHRANLVAISPQTTRQNSFTAEQHALPFPLLSDAGAAVAATFGIAHTIPERDRLYFQSILVNIPHANGGRSYATAKEADWRLPLPATFLIRPDNTVAFSEAYADFRVRPEPADLLQCLRTEGGFSA